MPATLAAAGVDRLLHHAHVVLTDGDSYRHAEAIASKGVPPHHALTGVLLVAIGGENWWLPAGTTRPPVGNFS